MITDYKTLLINLGTFLFSMTSIDLVLKVILLVVTIGYTLQKWWLLNKSNGKKKKQKKV